MARILTGASSFTTGTEFAERIRTRHRRARIAVLRPKFPRPRRLRLEASSACNLRCPSCPTTTGDTDRVVGKGWLAVRHFRQLLDDNPGIAEVELSNWGEVFVNPELVAILREAHARRVGVTLANGVNLNRCSDEALEALVKYGVRSMTISIDGASQETYGAYRVRGDFRRVLAHIDAINAHKKRLGRERPVLCWQFVVMGHNEHEIDQARRLAQERGMLFRAKLTWDDDFSPLRNAQTVREMLGHAPTRAAWREERASDYAENTCLQLWTAPQVNWDGKLLGCGFNFWGDFGDNVFEQGLGPTLGAGKMAQAKNMLRGKVAADASVPCATCNIYHERRKHGRWVKTRHLVLDRLSFALTRNRLWEKFRETPLWRNVLRPIARRTGRSQSAAATPSHRR